MTTSSLAAVAQDAVGPPIPFDNSYARLPEAFYERVRPLRVAAPQLLRLNEALAQKLRIDHEFLGDQTVVHRVVIDDRERLSFADRDARLR